MIKRPKAPLQYVETEGGPFVLLPLDNKKGWKGAGDEDEEDDDDEDDDDEDEAEEEEDGEGAESDYQRAEVFLATVGILTAGNGEVVILGLADVTTFVATDDGGVLIQRYADAPDDQVLAVVEEALATGTWKPLKSTFDAGHGKLALFDAAYTLADADEDAVLTINLGPGTYEVASCRVQRKDPGDLELSLVRLTRV